MAEQQVNRFRPVITATPGTPCGWTTYGETGTKLTCQGDRPAVHVLTETLPVAKAGTALCGYHSPFDPTDAERAMVEATYVKIMEGQITQAYANGDCACDLITELGAKRLPVGGRVCKTCGSIFTAEGDTPNGSVVAESNRIVAAKTKGEAGAEILAVRASTIHGFSSNPKLASTAGKCGIAFAAARGPRDIVTCPDCLERFEMDDLEIIGAKLIAEGDARIEATRVRVYGPVAVTKDAERDSMTGIDMIREAVALTPVRTPKVVTVHLGAFDNATACGRKVTSKTTFSAVTGEVTCKTCKTTARFANMAHREARIAAQVAWAEARLAIGQVVRQMTTGRFGMINELSDRIRIGFWSGTKQSAHYARLADFDSACQIITAEDLVTKGDVLASNLGGECTVEEVGATHVWAYVKGETAARAWTLSELAAEISRGWLAVVPPVPTMTMHLANTGRHVVSAFDLAEVGYQVTVAAGSPRNGVITQVSPWGALVRSNGGDIYWGLSLAEMVNGSVSVWLADSSGRPVGSWR